MKKEMITHEQLNRRVRFLRDFEVYKPVTIIKKIVGFSLLGYGFGTSWILFSGSYFAIVGGCLLLGIDYKKLFRTIKVSGKNMIDWAYGNRSWKLIKRNLKARWI